MTAVEEPGHMFCGSAGWVIGSIIGLLILAALLLFGLGVFGGPINLDGSPESSKVSSSSPIATEATQPSNAATQPKVASAVSTNSANIGS